MVEIASGSEFRPTIDIYHKALGRAETPLAKQRVDNMFTEAAQSNGDSALDLDEARSVERALRLVDEGNLRWLGLAAYTDEEVQRAQDLILGLEMIEDIDAPPSVKEEAVVFFLKHGLTLEETVDLIRLAAAESSDKNQPGEMIKQAHLLYIHLASPHESAKLNKSDNIALVKIGLSLEKFRAGAFADFCRCVPAAILMLKYNGNRDDQVVAKIRDIASKARGNTFLFLGQIVATTNDGFPLMLSEKHLEESAAKMLEFAFEDRRSLYEDFETLLGFGITNIDFPSTLLAHLVENRQKNNPGNTLVVVFICSPDIGADSSQTKHLKERIEDYRERGYYVYYFEADSTEQAREILSRVPQQTEVETKTQFVGLTPPKDLPTLLASL